MIDPPALSLVGGLTLIVGLSILGSIVHELACTNSATHWQRVL
jgi:hypothetical protein